jgi:DNA (cytosine-5)-methyltransferase 1
MLLKVSTSKHPWSTMSTHTVLDLFSGCGGIAWGFYRAGFKVLGGVDIEEAALQTFALNFFGTKAIKLDLSGSGVDELAQCFRFQAEELDVLVGGPPCQGFSKIPRTC